MSNPLDKYLAASAPIPIPGIQRLRLVCLKGHAYDISKNDEICPTCGETHAVWGCLYEPCDQRAVSRYLCKTNGAKIWVYRCVGHDRETKQRLAQGVGGLIRREVLPLV